jgi:hypothetical protein
MTRVTDKAKLDIELHRHIQSKNTSLTASYTKTHSSELVNRCHTIQRTRGESCGVVEIIMRRAQFCYRDPDNMRNRYDVLSHLSSAPFLIDVSVGLFGCSYSTPHNVSHNISNFVVVRMQSHNSILAALLHFQHEIHYLPVGMSGTHRSGSEHCVACALFSGAALIRWRMWGRVERYVQQ